MKFSSQNFGILAKSIGKCFFSLKPKVVCFRNNHPRHFSNFENKILRTLLEIHTVISRNT